MKRFGSHISIDPLPDPTANGKAVFKATVAMVRDCLSTHESLRSRGAPGLDLGTLSLYHVEPNDEQPKTVVGWVAESQ